MTRMSACTAGTLRDALPTLAVLAALAIAAVAIQRAWPDHARDRLPAVADALQSELGARVERIVAWTDHEERAIERAAADTRLIHGAVHALAGEPVEVDALLDRTCTGFEGCGLYTPDGHRVGAFRVRDLPEGLVAAGRAGTRHSRVRRTDWLGHLDPVAGRASFSVFFATPLALPTGRRLVLVGRAGADESLDPLVASRPIGRTGESYVFEEHGYMITRSRFETATVASAPRVLGRPAVALLTPTAAPTLAVSAVRGGRTLGIDIDGYLDYRGVVVVGAWRWIEELGAGVVTEIDRAEAMHAPVTALR